MTRPFFCAIALLLLSHPGWLRNGFLRVTLPFPTPLPHQATYHWLGP